VERKVKTHTIDKHSISLKNYYKYEGMKLIVVNNGKTERQEKASLLSMCSTLDSYNFK